jgi:hypothetical protein
MSFFFRSCVSYGRSQLIKIKKIPLRYIKLVYYLLLKRKKKKKNMFGCCGFVFGYYNKLNYKLKDSVHVL